MEGFAVSKKDMEKLNIEIEMLKSYNLCTLCNFEFSKKIKGLPGESRIKPRRFSTFYDSPGL